VRVLAEVGARFVDEAVGVLLRHDGPPIMKRVAVRSPF
jgi:hypothetical protein